MIFLSSLCCYFNRFWCILPTTTAILKFYFLLKFFFRCFSNMLPKISIDHCTRSKDHAYALVIDPLKINFPKLKKGRNNLRWDDLNFLCPLLIAQYIQQNSTTKIITFSMEKIFTPKKIFFLFLSQRKFWFELKDQKQFTRFTAPKVFSRCTNQS